MFILFDRFSKFQKNQQGNMAIMFALGVSVVSLITAASVDTASLVSTKSKMQDSLDTAALFVSTNKNVDTVMEDAKELFLSNFSSASNLRDLSVDFNISDDQVTLTAQASQSLFFGGVLNRPTAKISASTTVEYISESEQPPCIIALNPNAQPGITLNSGANIQTTGCEAQVHSTRNPAVSINSGVTWDVGRTCVAGSRITDNSRSGIEIETSCEVDPDPYEGVYPEPNSNNCNFRNINYNDSRITLSPGTYCGFFNFNNGNAKVTFRPGLYVIRDGGWNVNGGTWEGDGVTFYYADTSRIQFNSGVSANMSAPISGDYKDVFMTEAPGLSTSQFILNDSRGFLFEGILYLPSRQVIFNSGATTDLRTASFVADSFIFNGATLRLEGVENDGNGSAGGSVAAPLITN